jgi:hypothetical protein
MYQDLKPTYWWYGMKIDVAEYVAFCDPIRESRKSINDPLDYGNPCEYPSGNGKKLLWISM